MAPSNPASKKRKTSTASGVAGDGRPDMTSRLPDSILCSIFSLLSVRDVARAAVVSARWRHLFSSAECLPVTVDDDNLWRVGRRPSAQERWDRCSDMITSMFDACPGPIRRFCLRRTRPEVSVADGWMRTLALRGVQELVLHFPHFPEFAKSPWLRERRGHIPLSILDCQALRSLRLANAEWPRDMELRLPAKTLPRVTELTLENMDSENAEALVARCPALESLSVVSITWPGSVRIRCDSLRSLTVERRRTETVVLILDEAPNLERLLCNPWCLTSNSLETLGYLPKLQMLGVLTMTGDPYEPFMISHHNATNATKSVVGRPMHSVRTVAVSINPYDYDEVKQAIELLRLLPCLETLHVEITDEGHEVDYFSLEDVAADDVPSCVDNSLKTVVVRVRSVVCRNPLVAQRDLVCQRLAFVKFLLAKARVLEVITIRARKCRRTMVERLQCPASRASRDARVVFVKDKSCTSLGFETAACSTALADPFVGVDVKPSWSLSNGSS